MFSYRSQQDQSKSNQIKAQRSERANTKMKNVSILIVLLLGIFSFQQISCLPTEDQQNSAKAAITTLIKSNVVAQEQIFIGGLVRLAFHDCVGLGHCDGCINHDLADNKGLKTYTDGLETIFVTSFGMSRADFYVLAAYTALELATENEAEKFVISIYYVILL